MSLRNLLLTLAAAVLASCSHSRLNVATSSSTQEGLVTCVPGSDVFCSDSSVFAVASNH